MRDLFGWLRGSGNLPREVAPDVQILLLCEQWNCPPSAVRAEDHADVELAIVLGEARAKFSEYQQAQRPQ